MPYQHRTRRDLKKSMLERAEQEGRLSEVELLIDWRMALVNYRTGFHQLAIEEARLWEGDSRSVRMLNTAASRNGDQTRFIDQTRIDAFAAAVREKSTVPLSVTQSNGSVDRIPGDKPLSTPANHHTFN